MPRALRSNSTAPAVWNLEAHQQNANQQLLSQMAGINPGANALAVPPVAPPAPVVAEVWKRNPYSGDFNPGTKLGNSTFIEKTKGLPEADRLDLTKRNSQAIHRYLLARETLMGHVVTKVPIEYNLDGTIKKTANLLTQYQQMTLHNLQQAAIARYDTPLGVGVPIPQAPFTMRTLDPGTDIDDKKQFYLQVHSSVVVHIIKNGLTVQGYSDLLLQKDKFAFYNATTGETEYDGPIMMFLLFQKTDPSTIVGLDSVLKQIENAKLGDYTNDVDAMLTAIENLYKTLRDNHRAPENYRRLILDALATGPNHYFNEFIQRIEDDVESGIGANAAISTDSLITAARTKYNNMDQKGIWNKVDPRDAKIMALTTMVETMKGNQKGGTVLAVESQNQAAWQNKTTNNDFIDGLARWRIKHVGESKVVDGKTFYWCPHHVKEGKWNGMYVLHRPDQHKGKRAKSDAAPAANLAKDTLKQENKSGGTAADLQLQSKLKTVMCTNLCMSSEDVDRLFEEAKN